MSAELFWLVLTVAMTGLIWVPYNLDRIMVRGLMGEIATAMGATNDGGACQCGGKPGDLCAAGLRGRWASPQP